jgi:hypothetical protein
MPTRRLGPSAPTALWRLDVNDEQITHEPTQIAEDSTSREWLLPFMDHVEGQVAFGDTKASLLLTADSILLAAMSAVVTGERPLIDRLSTMSRTLLAMAFLALIVALLFALNTILPHRRTLWPTKKQEPTALPVSFGWIAGQKRDDYVEYALSTKTRDLNVGLARIIHAKSVWARRKFRRLYFATIATSVGVVLAAIAILVQLMNAGA